MTDGQMPVFDRFANSSLGVSYNGIGSVLDPSNQFVFPILRAESTTISVNDAKTDDDKSTEVEISGEQLTLVAGYQTRYNNRAAISGSIAMCSDEAMTENAANSQFCK